MGTDREHKYTRKSPVRRTRPQRTHASARRFHPKWRHCIQATCFTDTQCSFPQCLCPKMTRGVITCSSTALHVLLRRLMTSSVNLTSSDSDKWSCSTGQSHQICSLDRINSLQLYTETLVFQHKHSEIKMLTGETKWLMILRLVFMVSVSDSSIICQQTPAGDSITGGTAPRIGTGPL